MKVVMTLLVRNEEDIIRQNIEYHLAQGVDFIIARDNLSIDGTKTILMEYQRLGVLHYQFESSDNYQQHAWVTEMAQMAYRQFKADWVINSDADEFWWSESGEPLKQVFSRVPQTVDVLLVKRCNFPPQRHTTHNNFLSTMIFRYLKSFSPMGDPLPPKVCHRAAYDIIVEQGNHGVYVDGREINICETNDIVIFHYPVRTLEQITMKIYYGGRAYERSSLPQEIGVTWRKLFERLKSEGLEDYYNENVMDDSRLEQALQEKLIVGDRRLLDFFIQNKLKGCPGFTM